MKQRKRTGPRLLAKRGEHGDILGALRRNRLLRQRLAKFMALNCFRNSQLEDLHAGVSPDSSRDDYSDVKVISPFGEIPWTRLSRLNDAEMKKLMIDVVDRCYSFVELLVNARLARALLEALQHDDVAAEWNDPKPRRLRSAQRPRG